MPLVGIRLFYDPTTFLLKQIVFDKIRSYSNFYLTNFNKLGNRLTDVGKLLSYRVASLLKIKDFINSIERTRTQFMQLAKNIFFCKTIIGNLKWKLNNIIFCSFLVVITATTWLLNVHIYVRKKLCPKLMKYQ